MFFELGLHSSLLPRATLRITMIGGLDYDPCACKIVVVSFSIVKHFNLNQAKKHSTDLQRIMKFDIALYPCGGFSSSASGILQYSGFQIKRFCIFIHLNQLNSHDTQNYTCKRTGSIFQMIIRVMNARWEGIVILSSNCDFLGAIV